MRKPITRRDFLKLGALTLGSLAFQPANELAFLSPLSISDRLPPEDRVLPLGTARVTISQIGVYKEPNLKSEKVAIRKRDELVTLIEQLVSPYGPLLNPRWYRVVGGYAHSAYLQRVDNAHLNDPLAQVREGGQLGEVTVPYTQALRLTRTAGWVAVYRLYMQSVHWITGLDIGPDGEPWYKLTDELLRVDYHIPAIHMRPVADEEISPISPQVPWEKKSIEVSLLDQTVTAYEHGEVVLHTKVSTGLPDWSGSSNGISTVTPKGRFTVDVKMPSKHMGDGNLTADVEAYELPGVPWVGFFHPTGVGFHGTYWHDNFGARMSHGCVNMRVEDARWLYRWSLPVTESSVWEQRGFGTRVTVY